MEQNSTDDFLFAKTQSITPSKIFIEELIKNGKSPAEIDIFLRTGVPVLEHESLQCYVEARGYYFSWGHVLQSIVPIVGDEIHNCAIWNFCIDDLLNLFHEKGYFLDDLSRFVFHLLTSENSRPNFRDQIPEYIMVGEGNQVSSFELMVFETPENNYNEIEHAREWMACCFLDHILENLMEVVKKRANKLLTNVALDNTISPQKILSKVREERAVRRKRCTWAKSKLNKYLAELTQLKATGGSYADMQFWLRHEKRIKASRSTIKRFLDKSSSANNLES